MYRVYRPGIRYYNSSPLTSKSYRTNIILLSIIQIIWNVIWFCCAYWNRLKIRVNGVSLNADQLLLTRQYILISAPIFFCLSFVCIGIAFIKKRSVSFIAGSVITLSIVASLIFGIRNHYPFPEIPLVRLLFYL